MTPFQEYKNKTGLSVFDPQNQTILREFVNREVIQNMGLLVQHFLENPDSLDGSEWSWEDVMDITSGYDYEEAATDMINDWTIYELCGYLFDYGSVPVPEPILDHAEKALRELALGTISTAEKAERFYQNYPVNLENYRTEALEFWNVTEWFARKLKEKGESVGELFNLDIWGRGTSGQAILLDTVVAEIALEMEILVGQENDWSKSGIV